MLSQTHFCVHQMDNQVLMKVPLHIGVRAACYKERSLNSNRRKERHPYVLHRSMKLANTVFLVPSRSTWGGLMTVRRFSPASSGLFSLSMLKTRPSSCTCMVQPTSGLIQKKLQESYQVVVEPHLPPHICSHDLILPKDNVHPGQLLLPLYCPPHPPLPPLLQFLALQLHLWSATHQIDSVDESYIIV